MTNYLIRRFFQMILVILLSTDGDLHPAQRGAGWAAFWPAPGGGYQDPRAPKMILPAWSRTWGWINRSSCAI